MCIVTYDNIYKRQEEIQTVVGFSVFVREFGKHPVQSRDKEHLYKTSKIFTCVRTENKINSASGVNKIRHWMKIFWIIITRSMHPLNSCLVL